MKKVSLIILAAVALIGTIGCNNINPVGDAGQDAPSLPNSAAPMDWEKALCRKRISRQR
jgi:hypothetical protein